MRSIVIAASCLAVAFAAAAPAGAASEWQAERTLDQRVQSGTTGTIALHGDNGNVHFKAAETNVITIHARIRTHDSGSLAETTIAVQRSGNGYDLDARCPHTTRWWGYTNACDIEATITYPQGMNLDVAWVNGNVLVDNPRSDATVHLTNGDIYVGKTTGSVTLTARHGNVEAALAEGWHGNTVELAVSEGDVVVTVPPRFDGYFDGGVRLGDVNNRARLPKAPASAKSTRIKANALIGDVTIRN